ncbi:hypothetical protein JCM19992_00740 [Thermostilla marina]
MNRPPHDPFVHENHDPTRIHRRRFVEGAALLGGLVAGRKLRAAPAEERHAPLSPVGKGRGVCPGRVVWAHDPGAVLWNGPQDGYWWKGENVSYVRVGNMVRQAVCLTAGKTNLADAWTALFTAHNQARGKGAVGYRPGEKIAIKPNWVGMIFHEGLVDPETYTWIRRHNYMNTSPHVIMAVLDQLTTTAGVRQEDITIVDTLAYVVHEYYDIIHGAFPEVRFEDYAGKFGRIKVQESEVPLYWSSRPQDVRTDLLPTCFAQAEYLINIANFKAHTGGGVTLCAKNHYGSLIRWPAQKDYYNIHPECFSTAEGIYRPLVDLMGHAHLGGKTVLYMIDGLFSGTHPRDPEPQRMTIPPMEGQWSCSVFASQDPVAIDSVAFDFLSANGFPHANKGGVDDYLHEAALADAPPSGTFYDPNHAEPTERLASLGVHEHWNDPREKKYSRNLGKPEGIELIPYRAA